MPRRDFGRIAEIADADLAEVEGVPTETFEEVERETAALRALLDIRQGLRWLGVHDFERPRLHPSLLALFDGSLGDPRSLLTSDVLRSQADNGQPSIKITLPRGRNREPQPITQDELRMNAARALARAREQADEQVFLHWEVAFPDVWTDWESSEPQGGFDAIIGNPPWDRLKMQEVEWFASRKLEIAMQQRASDRMRMIEELKDRDDPLAAEYERARLASEEAVTVAREIGDYPLLSGGDVNIYSLFVERGLSLINSRGLVGLLTPSGIASDLTASDFFKSVSTTGRLGHLYDFENRRPPLPHFFPAVDSRFKFCTLVVGGPQRRFEAAKCAFSCATQNRSKAWSDHSNWHLSILRV